MRTAKARRIRSIQRFQSILSSLSFKISPLSQSVISIKPFAASSIDWKHVFPQLAGSFLQGLMVFRKPQAVWISARRNHWARGIRRPVLWTFTSAAWCVANWIIVIFCDSNSSFRRRHCHLLRRHRLRRLRHHLHHRRHLSWPSCHHRRPHLPRCPFWLSRSLPQRADRQE